MSFPSLSIGDLSLPVPIVQGGMGIGVSLSGLSAAVANAGGLGVIATAGIGFNEPDYSSDTPAANIRALQKYIQQAREWTKGVLGVNIMVVLTNYADMVSTAVAEGIDVIFSGAGLPMALPELVSKDAPTKLVPIISSARAAKVICKRWFSLYKRLPDALVVEGPKAGGHLGFSANELEDERFQLQRLIPEVVAAVAPFEQQSERAIPVIAAGGIYSGSDIHEALQLGASGVQMGTRFVATHECDASEAFKQSYIDAQEDDLAIIQSPVGLPGRAIKNSFYELVKEGRRTPFTCPYHCIRTCDYKNSPFCIALALASARNGNVEKGLLFAGANAYKVHEIVSVKELIQSLQNEFEVCCPDLPAAEAGRPGATPANPNLKRRAVNE